MISDNEKICKKCNKLFNKETHFIDKLGKETTNCIECRKNQQKLDKKRPPEHVKELAKINAQKPERKEVKKEWRENNYDKTVEYYMNYRSRKINENVDEYLNKNAEQTREWRKNNPEKVLESNKQQQNNIERSFYVYEYSAHDKNLLFELDFDYFVELVKNNCFYCGELSEKGFNGIDRIDCLKGYTFDNIVNSCEMCNYLKNCLSINIFLQRIIHILTYHEYINEFLNYELFADKISVPYSKYFKRANNKNIEFNITEEQYNKLIILNCYICGKSSDMSNINGIDRINNDIGYIKENVAPCCSECNYMKKNYTLKDFFEKIIKIYHNIKNSKELEKYLNNIGNLNNDCIVSHLNKKTKEEKEKIRNETKEIKKQNLKENYTTENIKIRAKNLIEKKKLKYIQENNEELKSIPENNEELKSIPENNAFLIVEKIQNKLKHI